jgi:hypothetical protein
MAIQNKGIDVLHSSLSSGSVNGSYIFGPATESTAITALILLNNTASDITVSLYVCGGGMNPFNNPEVTIVKLLTVPAYETVSFDQEKLVLGVGDSVQATVSTTWNSGVGLSATISTLPV